MFQNLSQSHSLSLFEYHWQTFNISSTLLSLFASLFRTNDCFAKNPMPIFAIKTQFSDLDNEQSIDHLVITMSHDANIRKLSMNAIIAMMKGMKRYLPFGMEQNGLNGLMFIYIFQGVLHNEIFEWDNFVKAIDDRFIQFTNQ